MTCYASCDFGRFAHAASQAYQRSTGATVAIKFLTKSSRPAHTRAPFTGRAQDDPPFSEFSVLRRLSHRNVTPILGVFETETRVAIVMECAVGELDCLAVLLQVAQRAAREQARWRAAELGLHSARGAWSAAFNSQAHLESSHSPESRAQWRRDNNKRLTEHLGGTQTYVPGRSLLPPDELDYEEWYLADEESPQQPGTDGHLDSDGGSKEHLKWTQNEMLGCVQHHSICSYVHRNSLTSRHEQQQTDPIPAPPVVVGVGAATPEVSLVGARPFETHSLRRMHEQLQSRSQFPSQLCSQQGRQTQQLGPEQTEEVGQRLWGGGGADNSDMMSMYGDSMQSQTLLPSQPRLQTQSQVQLQSQCRMTHDGSLTGAPSLSMFRDSELAQSIYGDSVQAQSQQQQQLQQQPLQPGLQPQRPSWEKLGQWQLQQQQHQQQQQQQRYSHPRVAHVSRLAPSESRFGKLGESQVFSRESLA